MQENKDSKILKESDIELIKILNLDKLEKNSVLILRINNFNEFTANTLKMLSDNYGDLLLENNCSFLVLSKDTDLSVVPEKNMNNLGWYKKGKIILPD